MGQSVLTGWTKDQMRPILRELSALRICSQLQTMGHRLQNLIQHILVTRSFR